MSPLTRAVRYELPKVLATLDVKMANAKTAQEYADLQTLYLFLTNDLES